jgi:hypothetical protein
MPTWEDSFPPVLRPWALPWWFIRAHTGNMMAYPYGGNHFGSIGTALLVLHGGRILWRKDRALLGLLLAPVGPAALAAALHRYPYGTSARISLYLAPAICLLAGQGLSSLLVMLFRRPRARRLSLAATGLLGLTAVVGAVVSVSMPYKHSSDLAYRRIARELAARARPGDRWLVFNGLDDLPRVKQVMLMPWLSHAAQFHYYVLLEAPVPVAWQPDPRALPLDAPGRIWMILQVMDYDLLQPPEYGPQLEALTRRFGPPSTEEFEAIPNEHVIAAAFGGPSTSLKGPSGANRLPSRTVPGEAGDR